MESMIARTCLSFREQGALLVSLSGAPLARSGAASAERAALDRHLDGLGEALEPLHGFRAGTTGRGEARPVAAAQFVE